MNSVPRICLNMIVKNETPVLERLFDSVKDIISYYVIVDTGSTDGTPDFIKNWMDQHNIPGELHHHDWVNFGHNRNQALEYAYQSNQADWLLIIDADEELIIKTPNFHQHIQPGTHYCLEKHYGNLRYSLTNLIDIQNTKWQWQGVVHEYLENVSGNNTKQYIKDAWIICHPGEGARSRNITDQQKFLNDVQLLETELKNNPNDPRSQFYLAQSYRDAGEYDKAYTNYLLRANMEGWVEETFVAQYYAGKIAIWLNKPYSEILECLLKAYEMRPERGAEPLYQLAAYCRNKDWHTQAYMFASLGSKIHYPNDSLFVEYDIYEWKIYDELSIAAYWTSRYQESKSACIEILSQSLPIDTLTRVNDNLHFATQKLS